MVINKNIHDNLIIEETYVRRLKLKLFFPFLLLMGIATSTSVYTAEIMTEHPAEQPELTQADQAKMEMAVDNLIESFTGRLLQTIDLFPILDISAAIQNRTIAVENITETIKELASLRASLDALKKILVSKPNIASIVIVAHALQTIGEIFKQWIDTGCTNIELLKSIGEPLLTWIKSDFMATPPDYLQNTIQRSLSLTGETLFEDLEKQINATEKTMTRVARIATTAGLKTWNKIFRSIEHRIINPLQKYHVPRLLGKAVISAGILLYNGWLIYGATAYNKDGEIPDLIKQSWSTRQLGKLFDKDIGKLKFLGQAPVMAPAVPTNSKDLRLLGQAQHVYNLCNLHVMGGILSPQPLSLAALIALWKNEAVEGYKFASQVGTYLVNRLRGGEYNKRAQFGMFAAIDSEGVTFDDVIGHDADKEYFRQIIQYMMNPERFNRTNVTPERGIMLWGETGTGKTYFLKAFQGELAKTLENAGRSAHEVNFVTVPATMIMQFGIAWLIKQAQEIAPAIIFIDEIDLLRLQRTGDNQNLADLLTFMQGSLNMDPPKKRVVFIGATNKANNIDKAVLRAGRFGKQFLFTLPTVNELEEFLRKQISNLALDPNDFNIAQAAQEAKGCTFEDVLKAVKATVRRAQTTGEPFTQASFDRSMDEEIRGILFDDNANVSDQELTVVATHMAGHVLARNVLKTTKITTRVTTYRVKTKIKEKVLWDFANTNGEQQKTASDKDIITGMEFTHYPNSVTYLESNRDIINEGKALVAGAAAELICLGDTHTYHTGQGQQNDWHEAIEKALPLIPGGNPEDFKLLSENKQNEIKDKAYALVQEWQREMVALFKEHRAKLDLLVTALKDKRTLSNIEIEQILDPNYKAQEKPAADFKLEDLFGMPVQVKK